MCSYVCCVNGNIYVCYDIMSILLDILSISVGFCHKVTNIHGLITHKINKKHINIK